MTKKEAIRIIVDCARLYHENLEGKNLLFIFGAPQNPECFEAVFMPRHFLHLTGVFTKLSSSDFYDRCLKSRLSVSDFVMPNDGTVEMKLAVLPQLMLITKTAKMIGDYDSSKSLLYTEKLAGGVSACMGFVFDQGFYKPNTALREDIRNVSIKPQKRILAIYRKVIRAPQYKERCFLQKGLDESFLRSSDEIKPKMFAWADDEKTQENKPSVYEVLKVPVPPGKDRDPEEKTQALDLSR